MFVPSQRPVRPVPPTITIPRLMEPECPFVCELEELASVPALTIHLRTPMRDADRLFAEGYRDIAALLARDGLAPAGPPFARYFNMDAEAVDIEFGFPVPPSAAGSGRIAVSATLSGIAACCTYIGPYRQIAPAYDALMAWIDTNGLAMHGETCEIYLNDPKTTPQANLKTRICLPVTVLR